MRNHLKSRFNQTNRYKVFLDNWTKSAIITFQKSYFSFKNTKYLIHSVKAPGYANIYFVNVFPDSEIAKLNSYSSVITGRNFKMLSKFISDFLK